VTPNALLPAPRPLRSVTYGFPLALSAPVVLAAAPALYRLGVGGLSVLLLIPVAILLAVVALVLSLVGLVATRRRGAPRGRAAAGLVVALAVLAFPAVLVIKGRGTAPIHDVTTDTDNPPQFVDVLPVRERTKALNPVAYGGARVADLQKRSYPDIRSLHLDVAPSQAFTRAQAAVQAMHWDLVAATPEAGRLEATDTTALFGFKDDVVVRVAAEGSGSRIDVRSLSRVGGGDLGANANRIRLYLQRLSASVGDGSPR
jgi:uncharacterized protein (DUF1499 family)